MPITLTPAAVDALRRAEITDNRLVLPDRLDVKTYKEVNRALERIGGAWNRRAKAHLFEGDPAEALAEILTAGQMPPKVKSADEVAAFWRTPTEIAERLVAKTGLYDAPRGVRVLEPSAGDGAIADVVVAGVPYVQLTCVEPDPGRHAALVAKGHRALCMPFEAFALTGPERFRAVVMNPPFAIAGHPVLWAEHVLEGWDLLDGGGVLAAVVPDNITREHRIAKEVKALVDTYGDFIQLPEDSFKLSRTNVRTGIVTLRRP